MIHINWKFNKREEIATIVARRRGKALEAAGREWVAEMRDYPPYAGRGVPSHLRHGRLAASLSYRVTRDAVHLLAASYARYLLHGTGVYGPRRAPIRGPFLWPVENPAHPLYPGMIFARETRGTIWRGKMRAVVRRIERAIRAAFRR